MQLIIAINFIASKNINEERVIHSRRDNIDIMSDDKADVGITEIFELLLSRYQIELCSVVVSQMP